MARRTTTNRKNAHNNGIMHLLLGAHVACRTDGAHMAVPFAEFETDCKPCARCKVKFERIKAREAARAEGSELARRAA